MTARAVKIRLSITAILCIAIYGYSFSQSLKSGDILGVWKYTKGADSIIFTFQPNNIAYFDFEEEHKLCSFTLDTSNNQDILIMQPKDKDSVVIMFYKINKSAPNEIKLQWYKTRQLSNKTHQWEFHDFPIVALYTLKKVD